MGVLHFFTRQKMSEKSGDEALDPESPSPGSSPVVAAAAVATSVEDETTTEPALDELAELQERGLITPFKAAKLRAYYGQAFERLEEERTIGKRLLQSAKDSSDKLEEQRATLAAADEDDEPVDAEEGEVVELREKYLSQMNQLWAAEERISMIEQEVTELTKEKRQLDRQLERIKPEQTEQGAEIKRNLEREQDEIKRENQQRRQEIEQLKELIKTKRDEADREKKYLKEALEEQEQLKNTLSSDDLFTLPQQLEKDIDKLKRQSDTQSKVKERLLAEIDQIEKKLNDESEKLKSKATEFEVTKMQKEEERIKLERNQQNENKLTHDLLAERDRTHELQIDLAECEMKLKHCIQERKREQEILARKQRELEREMRATKRKDLQLNAAKESLEMTQNMFTSAKEVIDLPNPAILDKQRAQLKGEVEVARRKLANQQSKTAMEKVKHEEMLIEEEHLFHRQEQERATLVELSRIRQIKEDEKEQKSRDLLRARERAERIVRELKQKELMLHDHKKRCLEIQLKQDDFAKLYDVIKNEKNKYVHMIQTSTQKAAELRDKLRVLANEVEILQNNASQRTKQLKKQELSHAQHCSERDALRNERAKMNTSSNQVSLQIGSRKLEIDRLNLMSQRAEEDARNLLVQYEKAVQHRNERGVTLVEREEEVCVFYERRNVQEQMIRDGEKAINEFDENLRFLKIQLAEEMRQIELLRSKKPEKRQLDNELVELQIQHLSARQEIKKLEESLANPTRARRLGGEDPSIDELKSKMEQLQLQMRQVEETALERELLFEQIERLVVKLEGRADDGKTPALELSRQLNAAQSQLNARTRTVMARVAELSMMKYKLLDSEQERSKLQEQLEDAYVRLEKGLAPTMDAQQEWKRFLDRQMDKEIQQERLTELTEGLYPLGGEGYVTTARPRPTAYIPKDGSLPIPRPYGALAPFKPTQPGSTMRHTRKPEPKAIDI